MAQSDTNTAEYQSWTMTWNLLRFNPWAISTPLNSREASTIGYIEDGMNRNRDTASHHKDNNPIAAIAVGQTSCLYHASRYERPISTTVCDLVIIDSCESRYQSNQFTYRLLKIKSFENYISYPDNLTNIEIIHPV